MFSELGLSNSFTSIRILRLTDDDRKTSYEIQPRILIFFVPTLVGEELYAQLSFFVQSIFVDRYIHPRGL